MLLFCINKEGGFIGFGYDVNGYYIHFNSHAEYQSKVLIYINNGLIKAIDSSFNFYLQVSGEIIYNS